MTIQQMEYVVALDNYRHFVKAAEACNVSQSTLSMMIKKLEEELDMTLFDRNSHPIQPTEYGEKIIAQIKVVLYNAAQIKEMTISEREKSSGEVRIAVIPTVAADIVPKLFKTMQKNCPDIHLRVVEMQTCDIVEKLRLAEVDMAVMVAPNKTDGLLEIPLFYEKFFAYISPGEAMYGMKELESAALPCEHLWTLTPGNCLRDQIFKMCNDSTSYSGKYEAGSIDTLVRIVDENGGYTIIPELHLDFLSDNQKKNVRPISRPEVVREISIFIRQDFVREKILNEIVDSIKKIIPDRMLDERLKKFAIRL